MYQAFPDALQAGHANEQCIVDELKYHGIEVYRPEGKSDYDFQLPDGKKCEVKLDLFAQRSQNGIIEFPSLRRNVDLYFHTLTSCRVYTHEQYQWLYMHGRTTVIGENGYDARFIPKTDFRAQGVFLDQFLKSLKVLNNN